MTEFHYRVEDLHAIFEKSLKAVCQLLIHQIRMDADGGAELVWNI